MEEIAEGVNALSLGGGDSYKKNRIQVSNTKKPLFFYVNLAKVISSNKSFTLLDLFYYKLVVAVTTTPLL